MRASSPGGRFTSDFETNELTDGITRDLTNPAGTMAQWWKLSSYVADPIYDVEPIGTGRIWSGPYNLRVVRATITQGSSPTNKRGFYNADTLHLTVNIDDFKSVSPEFFSDRGYVKPEIQNADKYRLVWKGQVYRATKSQQAGLVANRHTLIVLDLLQVMPDELVNDSQFLQYAQP